MTDKVLQMLRSVEEQFNVPGNVEMRKFDLRGFGVDDVDKVSRVLMFLGYHVITIEPQIIEVSKPGVYNSRQSAALVCAIIADIGSKLVSATTPINVRTPSVELAERVVAGLRAIGLSAGYTGSYVRVHA